MKKYAEIFEMAKVLLTYRQEKREEIHGFVQDYLNKGYKIEVLQSGPLIVDFPKISRKYNKSIILMDIEILDGFKEFCLKNGIRFS
tara:strand:- start:8547 stop:8804 length:258 start_codon:yes stop_codon:yes gene_type:complete